MLGARKRILAVILFQVLVPILVLRHFSPNRILTQIVNAFGNPIRTFDSGTVVVKAEINLFQIRICIQHSDCRTVCGRTQSRIGMLFPLALVHRNVRQHIYRSFEDK